LTCAATGLIYVSALFLVAFFIFCGGLLSLLLLLLRTLIMQA
jgi:hypothetical protein